MDLKPRVFLWFFFPRTPSLAPLSLFPIVLYELKVSKVRSALSWVLKAGTLQFPYSPQLYRPTAD